jgi:hypothetical protein
LAAGDLVGVDGVVRLKCWGAGNAPACWDENYPHQDLMSEEGMGMP